MHKGERLRAQINSPVFYRIMNVIFAILFTTALLLAIFVPVQYYVTVAWSWLPPSVAGGALFWFAYYWAMDKIPLRSPKAARVFIGIAAALYFALLLYSAKMLTNGVSSIGELGNTYHFAETFALSGTKPPVQFVYSGENAGFYIFLAGLFSIGKYFGTTDFLWLSIVVNAVIICTTLLLFYRVCNVVFGVKKAVMAFIGMMLFFSILFHVPVITPASVVLPAPLILALLWLSARKGWRKQKFGRVITKYIFLSALTATFAIVMPLIAFLWVAITVDLFILLSGKGKLRVFFAGLAVGGIVLFLLNWSALTSNMLPPFTVPLSVPYLSRFLMGLNGLGGYQYDVFSQVYAGVESTGGQLDSALVQAIQKSLSSLNIFPLWGNKLSATFSEPTFGASVALAQFSPNSNFFTETAFATGSNFFVTYLLAFALYGGAFVWMIVGAVKSVVRKNDCLTFLRIFLVLFFIYSLVWITGPQLLFVLFPVMLLCATEALPTGKAKTNKKNKEIVATEEESTEPKTVTIENNENAQQEPYGADERDELVRILEEFGEKMPEKSTAAKELFKEAGHEG